MFEITIEETFAAGHALRSNARFARRQRLVAGTVYLGLGAATALSGAKARK